MSNRIAADQLTKAPRSILSFRPGRQSTTNLILNFGLNLPVRIDSWKDMTVAEDLGFTSAWFYDSQMLYSDIYATMTLVAEHTKRIKIGTGIVVPSNRIAPVTAHAIATIDQLAPGRAMLGIGTGFTGRNMMGLPPVRLDDLREHVRICRALLCGDEVLFREGKRERWIRFMHTDRGYINIKENIPIVIAAQGPKALKVAGEIADGWMAPVSDVEGFKQNFDVVKSGAKRAGRDAQNFSATMFAAACVLKPGESLASARVLSQMGPMAAVALHALWKHRRLPRSFRHPCGRFTKSIVTNTSVDSTCLPTAGT